MSSHIWRADDPYDALLCNESPPRKEEVEEICVYVDGERMETVCYAVADGENRKTLLAAPAMKADITNFCAAMRSCETQADAAKIAKDFNVLFHRYT